MVALAAGEDNSANKQVEALYLLFLQVDHVTLTHRSSIFISAKSFLNKAHFFGEYVLLSNHEFNLTFP